MKNISCADLGGPCNEMISGNTPEELSKNGTAHVQMVHPEMAKDMANMSKEEGDKWTNDVLMPKWNSTPDM